MTDTFSIPPDRLADLVTAETQRLAARMAQDIFTRTFRLSLEAEAPQVLDEVADMERQARNWVTAAGQDDARALRLALLVSGLDQWGLAYCQAFDLKAIPGLTILLGNLRTGLDAQDDARFQRQFAMLGAVEFDGIDFKMELRRNIHLALWHGMVACGDRAEALPILRALASVMVALVSYMPQLGWRLVADALAAIQLRCLTEGVADGDLAQDMTRELFDVLRQALPENVYDLAMRQASHMVLASQQQRRWAN